MLFVQFCLTFLLWEFYDIFGLVKGWCFLGNFLLRVKLYVFLIDIFLYHLSICFLENCMVWGLLVYLCHFTDVGLCLLVAIVWERLLSLCNFCDGWLAYVLVIFPFVGFTFAWFAFYLFNFVAYFVCLFIFSSFFKNPFWCFGFSFSFSVSRFLSH